MIVTPSDWATVGEPIEIAQIEDTLVQILTEIDCNSLSFSGGIDSSLLLYYMLKQGRRVRTFTVGLTPDHPDVTHARLALDYFDRTFECSIDRTFVLLDGLLDGDAAVAEFYKQIAPHTDSIITGDGIDELMAGYYGHQDPVSEESYYFYLRALQKNHLEPLNKNSGPVQVHIPYIDRRLIHLLTQIPLHEKVDQQSRKKLMIALAMGKVPDEIIFRRKAGFCQRVPLGV